MPVHLRQAINSRIYRTGNAPYFFVEDQTMQNQTWLLALGVSLLVVVSAQARIIKGVISVTGAEMS